ncbi:MAG: hypothetical protein SGPRY_006641 [Prymnesium sp.]
MHVFSALSPLSPHLEPRARFLTDSATTDRAVLALRQAICSKGVCTAAQLRSTWVEEPRYLLREIAALAPPSARALVLQMWPELLVQADQLGKARRP